MSTRGNVEKIRQEISTVLSHFKTDTRALRTAYSEKDSMTVYTLTEAYYAVKRLDIYILALVCEEGEDNNEHIPIHFRIKKDEVLKHVESDPSSPSEMVKNAIYNNLTMLNLLELDSSMFGDISFLRSIHFNNKVCECISAATLDTKELGKLLREATDKFIFKRYSAVE